MLWTYFAFPEDERVFFLFSSLTEVKTKSKDPIKILKMKQLANKEPFFPSNWAPSAVRLWGDLFSFGDGRLRCDATVSVWTGGLPALPFSPLPLFKHPLDNACPETTVCQLGTWDNAHMHTQDTTSQPRTSEDTHIGHMIISSLQNVKCSTHTHSRKQCHIKISRHERVGEARSVCTARPKMCRVWAHTSPGSSVQRRASLWPTPTVWPVSVTTKERNDTMSQSRWSSKGGSK